MREIPLEAKVCDKCGGYQGKVWNFLNRLVPLISLAGVFFLAFQVFIASQQINIAKEQVKETKTKRIEAESVLKEAEQALKEAKQAEAKADHILIETERKVALLTTNVESIVKKLNQTEKRLVSTEKSFSEKQQTLSHNVISLKDELSKEIDKLEMITGLINLANKSISTSRAEFYDELKKKQTATQGTEMSAIVNAQILSVKKFYIGTTRIKGRHLKIGGIEVKPKDLTTEELLFDLSNNKNWVVRALVSKELGSRKEKDVPEALINCAENDEILDVRRDCIDAFELVIDKKYESPDILDASGIIKYWSENKEEIEKNWANK